MLICADVYKFVSITLLEAAHTVLGSFDKSVRHPFQLSFFFFVFFFFFFSSFFFLSSCSSAFFNLIAFLLSLYFYSTNLSTHASSVIFKFVKSDFWVVFFLMSFLSRFFRLLFFSSFPNQSRAKLKIINCFFSSAFLLCHQSLAKAKHPNHDRYAWYDEIYLFIFCSNMI